MFVLLAFGPIGRDDVIWDNSLQQRVLRDTHLTRQTHTKIGFGICKFVRGERVSRERER